MAKISKEYGLLVEEVGVLIEERADLSPLAARIYATLILASAEGLTFEDITEAHQASKSSVSNNLNILVMMKYAEYYTKPGERKRYFKASKYYVKTAMEKYNDLFEREINVVEKINCFNRKNNPEKFHDEQSVGTLYLDYLCKIRDGFKDKIEQLNAFDNQS